MSDELKPCPLCGGEAECDRTMERYEYLIEGDRSCMDYGYTVYCTQCGLETHVRDTPPNDPDEAIDAWNTRSPEDALRQRIAELEQQLAALRAETWQPVGEPVTRVSDDDCTITTQLDTIAGGTWIAVAVEEEVVHALHVAGDVRLCKRGGA